MERFDSKLVTGGHVGIKAPLSLPEIERLSGVHQGKGWSVRIHYQVRME